METTNHRIPIVLVCRSGNERVIGQAHDMAGAERLLDQLSTMYAPKGLDVYIDCARTVEEVQAGS